MASSAPSADDDVNGATSESTRPSPRRRKATPVSEKRNSRVKPVRRSSPGVPLSTRSRKKTLSTVAPLRTSKILRNILETHSGKFITIKQIVDGLGATSFGTSLMVFSLPEALPIPIPGISAAVVIPTGIISYQMIRGKKQIQLPNYLLKRSIPRKGFEAAIQVILPLLEKAEKAVKPLGRWVEHPWTKRFLGLFIMMLAGVIALPIPGTNMPAAIAIFLIALGMVEKDGLLISLGILLGLASIALVGGLIFGLLSLLGW